MAYSPGSASGSLPSSTNFMATATVVGRYDSDSIRLRTCCSKLKSVAHPTPLCRSVIVESPLHTPESLRQLCLATAAMPATVPLGQPPVSPSRRAAILLIVIQRGAVEKGTTIRHSYARSADVHSVGPARSACPTTSSTRLAGSATTTAMATTPLDRAWVVDRLKSFRASGPWAAIQGAGWVAAGLGSASRASIVRPSAWRRLGSKPIRTSRMMPWPSRTSSVGNIWMP